jgi:hypothetical protein
VRHSSRTNRDRLPRSSAFFNFFAVSGGIPTVIDGQMIGRPSASAAGGGDESCAIDGLKAIIGEQVTLSVDPAAAGGSPVLAERTAPNAAQASCAQPSSRGLFDH